MILNEIIDGDEVVERRINGVYARGYIIRIKGSFGEIGSCWSGNEFKGRPSRTTILRFISYLQDKNWEVES